MFARRLCCRIPGFPGLRPVALRPTFSGGLPLSGCESFRSYTGSLQGGCQRTEAQVLENNARFWPSRSRLTGRGQDASSLRQCRMRRSELLRRGGPQTISIAFVSIGPIFA